MSLATSQSRRSEAARGPYSFPARLLPIVTVIAAVGAAYVPITVALISQGDFPNHIRRAVDLTRGIIRVPHLLFHTLVAATILVGAQPLVAAIAVTMSLQIAAALCVFWYVQRYGSASPFLATALAIAILAVGPILPPGSDRDLTPAGYFLPNAIHNPTVIAAKPFVPVLLAIGTWTVGLTARPALNSTLLALLVVLAAMAKPHYVSCVLAAAVGCAIVRRLSRHAVPWRQLACVLVLPSVAILTWTSIGTLEIARGGSAIIAPLAVLRLSAAVDPLSVVQRIISDIAFPLAVAVLWPGRVVRFAPLVFASVAYTVALGQAFLLAESGPRLVDGNFMWSPQLATFGMMTASAAFLAREVRSASVPWRAGITASVLLLHVAYGAWWVLGRI
jgi:hypothetical protein